MAFPSYRGFAFLSCRSIHVLQLLGTKRYIPHPPWQLSCGWT